MAGKVYDLAVVGGGILGLAHALAARRLGLRVVVLEREPAARGASIRNFGFVTVTGQAHGAQWHRALRTRDVWDEVAAASGLPVLQHGLALACHTEAGHALLEAFMGTEMGRACRLLDPEAAATETPGLNTEGLRAVLHSPHDRRVEAREAIATLAAWLAESLGVELRHGVAVHAVEPPDLATSVGPIEAESCVVCPGADTTTLFPDAIAAHGVTRCQLNMLRAMPAKPGYRLPAAVMNDLSLVRYPGYATMPQAAALRARLEADPATARALDHGIHLIAVQSADGSLVLGDSHDYGAAPEPFQNAEVDDAILAQARRTLDCGELRVRERWTGIYPSADEPNFVAAPAARVRLAMVTSGTGMSTAFALGEEVVGELFNADPAAHPLPARAA